MTFQLDTSGTIYMPMPLAEDKDLLVFYRWSDLSPFTQGYVEALFTGADRTLGDTAIHDFGKELGFSDLAPETLARIIEDCEERLSVGGDWPDTDTAGEMFWLSRQRKGQVTFPPLTVQLGDDGKVRFAA